MLRTTIIFVLCFVMSSCIQAEPQRFSAGLGLGAMYAQHIGVNGTVRIFKRSDLFASLAENGNYALGGRVHILDNLSMIQPRVTFYYGTNRRLVMRSHTTREDILWIEGFSVGGGTRLAFGQRRVYGIDFDVMYAFEGKGYRNAREKIRREGREIGQKYYERWPYRADFPIQLSLGFNYKW